MIQRFERSSFSCVSGYPRSLFWNDYIVLEDRAYKEGVLRDLCATNDEI